jgi:hypothetical protein
MAVIGKFLVVTSLFFIAEVLASSENHDMPRKAIG